MIGLIFLSAALAGFCLEFENYWEDVLEDPDE